MKASTSLFVGARAPLLEAAGFRTVRPVWVSLLIWGDAGRLPRGGCPAGEGFACCDDLGRGPIGSGGVGLARRLGGSIPRPSSARLRQTVDDSVPTPRGFPPLPVTPAAVNNLIMSCQRRPRRSAVSNQTRCPATNCDSFILPPARKTEVLCHRFKFRLKLLIAGHPDLAPSSSAKKR
jgi:hypothetical protein